MKWLYFYNNIKIHTAYHAINVIVEHTDVDVEMKTAQTVMVSTATMVTMILGIVTTRKNMKIW